MVKSQNANEMFLQVSVKIFMLLRLVILVLDTLGLIFLCWIRCLAHMEIYKNNSCNNYCSSRFSSLIKFFKSLVTSKMLRS